MTRRTERFSDLLLETLSELLARCSGLHLLVTSRATLRLRGEHQLPHLRWRTPAQALQRGAVLAVHRQQLAAPFERGPHQRPADDQRLLVGECQPQAPLKKNLCSHRTLFAQQAQQQMFGPDVPVLQAI